MCFALQPLLVASLMPEEREIETKKNIMVVIVEFSIHFSIVFFIIIQLDLLLSHEDVVAELLGCGW